MEPTEIKSEVKIPRYSRTIAWLGGASLGRSHRAASLPRFTHLDILSLALLDVGMLATSTVLFSWGALFCTISAAVTTLLTAVWFKLFFRQAKIFFRGAAVVTFLLQILYLQLYVSRLQAG